MENKIRLRFAPSPTGFLHIGSLRTVLFSYIIAKKLKGKLILRIEDTDQKREVRGATESLVKILDWVGLEFDEGPHIGGNFGPYIQTERLDIYNKKIKNDEKFVIRQAMPLSGETVALDEIRGKIKFKNAELDDHVLIKSNGIPTYQFASVVDDHIMEISHVTRAEEWIPSFPKNILLYQAFGWKAPKFIHYPFIANKEGGKLSKRQGDVAVEDFRDKGYLPEALINFCGLLGWHPKDDNEILSLDEIIAKFELGDMGAKPAIFDIEKLGYFNGYYIRHKPIDDLVTYLQAKELRVGEYLWPMRVALCGQKASPGPFDIAEILGKSETMKRIEKSINLN